MSHCAKKVISDSPVLVNFVDGPLGSFIHLPDGQVTFLRRN